nr:retrovirus-related Pol polyprotein from transposon TNT 1-94 [Tanacetum cinerariifolium]
MLLVLKGSNTEPLNGVAERRNKKLIEAARTMLADSKLPITFWVEAFSTTCYVQKRVLIVKPHNKTPYELFRGFKPALSFMRLFGCHVTILSTLDNLGKFDGKSDEGFFVGYSLSSKAFRVYNTRTRKVEENLHIRFFENRPMKEGNGPKWLFDIDSITQSMNYVPVAAGIILDESADDSYFDSPSKDVEDGLHNEDDDKDKSEDDSSPKEVNATGQHVNTASLEVNTGASDTLEATHVEFFSDRDAPEVDLGNIPNSYGVPQDYNASSVVPCLFIHSIYVIPCLYIHLLSVMLNRISFHVLYGRAATGTEEEQAKNFHNNNYSGNNNRNSGNGRDQRNRVDKRETWPKNIFAHKNVTPRAVLLKNGKTPISRPNMNVAQPKMTSFAKTAHSTVKRSFQEKLAVRTQPRVLRVSTVTKTFSTIDSKFPTVKSTFTADLGNKGKAVKASAC